MDIDEKIYVAGHRGMVGSALVRTLEAAGYRNLVLRTHAELDLADAAAARRFFDEVRPAYVFLAAARVGGIVANNTYPAEFIFENIKMQTNVIGEAHRTGVKRLLFLGSSCIYPRDCPQPISEDSLLTGPLESTNRPYAVAKIAGVEMCWAFNRQYDTRYLATMPSNLYGLGDNFDLQTSHVLPALIRKLHEGKIGKQPEVVVWGTGRPRREFLYSDDLAEAAIMLMRLPDGDFKQLIRTDRPPLINIGCGQDLTIAELAQAIAKVVGFQGALKFDPSKPDGTPRKLLDITRMRAVGWQPKTSLEQGLARVYADFQRARTVS